MESFNCNENDNFGKAKFVFLFEFWKKFSIFWSSNEKGRKQEEDLIQISVMKLLCLSK